MTEHEDGMWCWCRPRAYDNGFVVVIVHRDIDPSVLAGRLMYGGETDSEYAGAIWVDGAAEMA